MRVAGPLRLRQASRRAAVTEAASRAFAHAHARCGMPRPKRDASCRSGRLSGSVESAFVTSWQPIATAPRDGTVVLVWTRTGCHLAACVAGQPEGWMEKDANYLLTEDTTGLPTHWMPLPLPPGRVGTPAPAI